MKRFWVMVCRYYDRNKDSRSGCCGPILIACMTLLFVLCSCTTQRSTESSIDIHRMSVLTQLMDSMLHATSTWQQSIYQKQTALVDSLKQKEVRDTSRTVFLGANGDTVKQTTIIREYIERDHSTKESEKEYWEERFRKTDSLLQVSLAKQEKMDSTLQLRQKDTVVERNLSWWDQTRIYGCYVLAILLVILYRKPIWKFVKKLVLRLPL